jgi:hypothetical protein
LQDLPHSLDLDSLYPRVPPRRWIKSDWAHAAGTGTKLLVGHLYGYIEINSTGMSASLRTWSSRRATTD